MDVDTLSPSQRRSLDQLQVLTDGGDPEVAISVLDSVGWDVQVSYSVVQYYNILDTVDLTYALSRRILTLFAFQVALPLLTCPRSVPQI